MAGFMVASADRQLAVRIRYRLVCGAIGARRLREGGATRDIAAERAHSLRRAVTAAEEDAGGDRH